MCILNSNFRYAQIIYVWLTTCENEEKVLKIEIRKTTSVEIKIENKRTLLIKKNFKLQNF